MYLCNKMRNRKGFKEECMLISLYLFVDTLYVFILRSSKCKLKKGITELDRTEV